MQLSGLLSCIHWIDDGKYTSILHRLSITTFPKAGTPLYYSICEEANEMRQGLPYMRCQFVRGKCNNIPDIKIKMTDRKFKLRIFYFSRMSDLVNGMLQTFQI